MPASSLARELINQPSLSILHQASRWIIYYLDSLGIGKLIIGENPLWKQKVNLVKINNQSFIFIPDTRGVKMLIYKGYI